METMTNQPEAAAIERLKELLEEIDDIARNHDNYDYGLPIFNDEIVALMMEKMQAAYSLGISQRDGWRCFHCDETFTDEAEAKEHFGADNFCMPEVPGCIDPLRTDEKARLKELHEAQEHAMKMQAESEKNDEAEGLLENFRHEIGRLFGECGGVIASTPHQAWLKLEAAQNLALAEFERGISQERECAKWISVEEKLPEKVECYLGFVPPNIIGVCFFADGKWNWPDNENDREAFGLTHWMPLPEPPKGDSRGV